MNTSLMISSYMARRVCQWP